MMVTMIDRLIHHTPQLPIDLRRTKLLHETFAHEHEAVRVN